MQCSQTDFPLTSLYLYLSSYCNLRCVHCWISPDYSQKPDNGVNSNLLLQSIIQAKDLGLQRVKLTGGEPLLYKGLPELLKFLAAEAISISIETNGTLIDSGFLKALLPCNVEQVCVSLDGACAQVHDRIRGVKGSFDLSIAGIKLLREAQVAVQIIMTLQRINYGELEPLIELCNQVGVQSLKINHMIPFGRAKNIGNNQNVTIGELIEAYRKVTASLSGQGIEIVFDLPLAFRSVTEIQRTGCSECRILNILGILANGDFSICGIGQAIDALRMGNISKDSIKDVWQKHPVLLGLRNSLPMRLNGVCGNCIFRFRCLGACRANAYAVTQDFYSPYFLCQELYDAGLFPASRLDS